MLVLDRASVEHGASEARLGIVVAVIPVVVVLVGEKLLRHLVGHNSSHAFSHQQVRAVRLNRAHFPNVVGSHLFCASVRLLFSIRSAGTQSITRKFATKILSHSAIDEKFHIASPSTRNQEERLS